MNVGRGKVSLVPEMEQTINITQSIRKVKNSLFWGTVNAVVLSIVLYDIINTCPSYTETVHLVEKCFAVFLGINTIFHYCRYLWTKLTIPTVILTPQQKSLFGIKDSETYYFETKTTPVDSPRSTMDSSLCMTPMNLSTNSWLSNSYYSSDQNRSITSPNYSLSSPSWTYQPGSPSRVQFSTPPIEDQVIENENSLSAYLNEYENLEKSQVVSTSVEHPTNLLSGFWSHPASKSPAEVSPLLKKNAYQISSPSDHNLSGNMSGDEVGSPRLAFGDVFRKNVVNPTLLTHWTSNLRMWISETILSRLVQEIETINKGLHAQGLVDVTIGLVGIDRLKKTACSPQVVFNVPTLQNLVPFLDFTPYQEYIVSRIKDLARGGCMSEYKWNTGGHWNGKDWTDHLPTDAELVLHLLATYLDLQLPSAVSLSDGRPFSSVYLFKYPNKPIRGKLAIIQETVQPPHYKFQTKEDMFDVPKGRNNLFYTVLLFLHAIKTKEDGMLGRMNLGPSGINMQWIIDS
uniref:Transmembrane protein 209 n=1 Tax=Clastoptera arizonana TaxID=38151 RepID=A0A1B6DCW7_9HEMI